MANHMQRKIPLHQKIKYSVVGAIASIAVVLIPAYALIAEVNPMQFGQMIDQMKEQVKNSDKQVKQGDKQRERLDEITREGNTISPGVKNGLTTAVQTQLDAITNGPVGTLMRNAGLSITNVTGPAAVGHVNSDTTKRQMTEIGAVTNPISAITAQTKITLEDKLHDRLNVTSMLDEKPMSGTCKTAAPEKCTTLIRLREMDAVSLNSLQATNVLAIGEYALQGNKFNTNIITNFYEVAGTTRTGSGAEHINKIFRALTPSPSITLGFERTPEAADLNKSRWLSHVLIGQKNDVNLLLNAIKIGGETQQVDALSKLAKMQIARSAIMNVHNPDQHNALNAQFRACVVRPDAQDRIGATQEQQLVHIQALLRCSNMIQLQSRQQEMESQRIMGTMLLTLLDLYAVQSQAVTKK